MAEKDLNGNKLTKAERTALSHGCDLMIASLSRMNQKEQNTQIKEIREGNIQEFVILKNKLVTKELEL